MSNSQGPIDSSSAAILQKVLFTVDEVAQLLGCSPRTIYRYADAGMMPPAIKIGNLVRWHREVVETWIGAGCPRHRPLRRAAN